MASNHDTNDPGQTHGGQPVRVPEQGGAVLTLASLKRQGYNLPTLRGDVFGGITSMVLALPVALGFGIASGMGAAAGLYGAIIVGFFAAVFGGTRSQISGPTPAMTVAMATIMVTYSDSLAEALTIVVLAGLMQVLLGLSKIGRFVAYTPHVVVSGFMSGIGVIVILVQALPFLGKSTTGGPLDALAALPEAVASLNPDAVIIGAVTLLAAFLWPRRLDKALPAPLAALAIGTALGVLWLTDAPVIGTIPTGLPSLHLTLPEPSFYLTALQPALILALLGSVDALLTSLVADSLTGNRHNPDRELVGQGIGNMAAGLFGALPGAGATVGTVTNIRAGGRTPLSGVLRSALLLAVVLGLGGLVDPIPLAALAGVLVKVGWDIIDWRMLARVHRLRTDHLLVMLITLMLTIFVDLVTAVAIGLIAGGMAHARQLEQLELDSVVSTPLLDRVFFAGFRRVEEFDTYQARVGLLALRGSFTVASSHRLVSVIGEDIKDHDVVMFDFSEATYIDDSAAMVIEQLLDVAERADTHCIMIGLSGSVAATLDTLNILHAVGEESRVRSLDEARPLAAAFLGIRRDSRGPTLTDKQARA